MVNQKLSTLEFFKKQFHATVNFIVGATILISVIFLHENTFGRILQIVLVTLSIFMLAEKTWKFVKRGFLNFTIEDAYIFLSALILLILLIVNPQFIVGLIIKITFGIAGVVLMILAISDFFRHLGEYGNVQSGNKG
jgi:hypothetical protein